MPTGFSSSPRSTGGGHTVQLDHRLLGCPQCSFKTPLQCRMKVHQRIHSGERPHQCHLCPSAFAQKGNLVAHLRSHTGEKPFGCRFCPEAFAHRIQQKRHEKKHSRRVCVCMNAAPV